MRGTLLVMAMAIALALSMMSTAFAGGSADKATGTVEFTNPYGPRAAYFNAHEEKDGRPAKGEFTYAVVESDGSYTPWITMDVTCAYIDGDTATAWFAGEVTYSIHPSFSPGDGWAVKAVDNGDPATDGPDFLGWSGSQVDSVAAACDLAASSFTPSSAGAMTDGNLKVHAEGSEA